MRFPALLLAAALTACAATTSQTSSTLVAADAATALITGQRITMTVEAPTGDDPYGGDAIILMRLRHADGRVMSFDESNHAPMHVMAQTPGGPLAQIMGLFGEERPTLYGARAEENRGEPFICGPEGPVSLGVYRAPDGTVQVVGLKQPIDYEPRPDGSLEALPYSPDQVCARMRFRRG